MEPWKRGNVVVLEEFNNTEGGHLSSIAQTWEYSTHGKPRIQ